MHHGPTKDWSESNSSSLRQIQGDSITSDFSFGPAVTDDPYQRVIEANPDDGDIGALLATLVASGLVVVASAAVGVFLIVRHRRRVPSS